jgi:glutathione S-transferase
MVLYFSRFCGYCFRVLRTLDKLGVSESEVMLRDVTLAPHARQDIIQATGRRTVPVLRIPRPRQSRPDGDDHQWLFESREIVRYLSERYPNQRSE